MWIKVINCVCFQFISFVIFISSVSSQLKHRRFEYKYSFKGPYLAQKDNQVPFWTYSGSAIASEESFRITPSLRSQKGQAWAKNPINFEWWEIEIVFRVNGRGRIGADGLALWYTAAPGVEGPVFGSSDKWNGLGLFFDSFDNDNKRNNPYVMGMANNGLLAYDHEQDGSSQQMGGCLRDFRNKAFPIRAKVEYFKNVLTVYVHNGMTDNENDYEICFRADGITLPPNGYYGVTAATGGLADDHDVLQFLVTSLRSSEEMAELLQNKEEEAKFQQEFDQYQEKTKKARDEYIAQNPDAMKTPDQQEYQTSEQRELGQIFQGQSQIFEIIRHLNSKLDEILGKQERTLGLVSGGVPAVNVAPGPGGVNQLPAPTGDTMNRNEVNVLLSNQREMVQNIREVKSTVGNVHGQTQQILSKSTQGQGSVQPVGGAGGGYEANVVIKEMNEGINILKRDLLMLSQRFGNVPAGGPAKGGPLPLQSCPSCISTMVFVLVMAIHGIILIGYLIYRDSKEAKAKKLY